VYRAANGEEWYFYFGSDSTWWVSGEEEMRAGQAAGWVHSVAEEPDALTPDRVQGGWKVADGGKLQAAASVRVRQVRRARRGGVELGAV
jgi:hypothetical protein